MPPTNCNGREAKQTVNKNAECIHPHQQVIHKIYCKQLHLEVFTYDENVSTHI